VFTWGVLQNSNTMKKLIKLAFLLFPIITFAQETKTVEVYNYVGGVKEIFPTQIVEIKENKIEVFDVNFGIKNLTPKTIIENNEVYKVENGFKSLFPIQRLEVQTNSPILPIPSLIGVGGFNLFD
jgi:translation elongation factor EF-1beta